MVGYTDKQIVGQRPKLEFVTFCLTQSWWWTSYQLSLRKVVKSSEYSATIPSLLGWARVVKASLKILLGGLGCLIAFIRLLATPAAAAAAWGHSPLALGRGCSTGSTRLLRFGSLDLAWKNTKIFNVFTNIVVKIKETIWFDL